MRKIPSLISLSLLGMMGLCSDVQAAMTGCRAGCVRAVSCKPVLDPCGSCGSGTKSNCEQCSSPGQWVEQEQTVYKPVWGTESRPILKRGYQVQQQLRHRVTWEPYQVAQRKTRIGYKTVYRDVPQIYHVRVPCQIRRRCYRPELKTVVVPVRKTWCAAVPHTEVREAVRTHMTPVTTSRVETYPVLVRGTTTKQATRTTYQTIEEQQEVAQTVMVPYVETREATQRICRRVPVMETDEACDQCQSDACDRCVSDLSCCSPCQPVTRYATEQFEKPYTYTVRGCRPETQVRMQTVCKVIPVEEAYDVTVPVWTREQRSRTVKTTEYVPVRKKHRYQVTSWQQEQRSRIAYVRRQQWFTVAYDEIVNGFRYEARQRTVRVAKQVPVRESYLCHVTKYRQRRTAYPVKVRIPVTIKSQARVRVCKTVPTTLVRRVWVPNPCGHVVGNSGSSKCSSCSTARAVDQGAHGGHSSMPPQPSVPDPVVIEAPEAPDAIP